jgi:hypothetical protein
LPEGAAQAIHRASTEVPGMSDRKMTEAQRAYETKRAAKAGMSLDKWLADKEKRAAAEVREEAGTVAKVALPKKAGFFGRLLEKAQKPL